MVTITKSFKFCAAHAYRHPDWSEQRNRSVFGDDYRVHGHNYDLELTLTGPVDPDTGFITDLGAMKRIVNEKVINVLDHSQIEQDIPWFEKRRPSSENLVLFIWEQLDGRMPEGVRLVRIRLYETPTIFAECNGETDLP